MYRKSLTEVYSDIIMVAYFTFHIQINKEHFQENISQWFRVRTYNDLSPERLSFNNLVFVAVYDYQEPRPGKALDEYLVPYTRTELLDGEGAEMLAENFAAALKKPCRITGNELAKRMKLKIKYYRLAENNTIRGQIYFEKRYVDILDKYNHICRKLVEPDTIVINTPAIMDDDTGLKTELLDDTLIHECYHASQHRLFYLGQRLYNEEIRCLSCSMPGMLNSSSIDKNVALTKNTDMDIAVTADAVLAEKSPIDWIEWQADRVTPRIRMPSVTAEMKINELYAMLHQQYPYMSAEKTTECVVAKLAEFFGVSKQSAKRRMVELGHTEAQGVLNYVNGAYTENHSFAPGSLSSSQTFTIDLYAAAELYAKDKNFRKRLFTGCYQYIDGHYCRMDKKYVYNRYGELHLTSYARSHMDECCLVFTQSGGKAEYIYQEGSLQKSDKTSRTHAAYSDIQPIDFDYHAEGERLSRIMYDLPASPNATLVKHMQRQKITVETLVAKSGVSESTIRRLRNDPSYRTNRNTIFAICIGLRLEPLLQKDLLRKCGICFSGSPEDTMYELMLSSMYQQPVSAFNQKLVEYGFPPLISHTNELDA